MGRKEDKINKKEKRKGKNERKNFFCFQEEYSVRYPRGVNPVQVNDIVFAVHAAVACVITIIQCFIYERGEQRVSWIAKGILAVFAVFLLISIILSGVSVIHWLDFLYYCSYVKLTITLIKYVPQAYMNYRRKSTVGWSIGNIFLDFTGGMLSMLQMILNAYNYGLYSTNFCITILIEKILQFLQKKSPTKQ